MDRALREFRIRGVATNLQFLENLINHPAFVDDQKNELTTRFIENTPELLAFAARRDRASKMLRFLAEVAVHGNPEVTGRTLPALPLPKPVLPLIDTEALVPDGTRQRLQALARPASRSGCWLKSRCWSPTPPCATRTSRYWPRACAPPTCCRSRPTTRVNCQACCRWNAGAAPPSTWHCAS
jgi:hypothetical protein